MGFFSAIGKLMAGETLTWEKTTTFNSSENLLTGDRQKYVGEWSGENSRLLIKPDGTIEYRREETVGDTTNTNTVSGPINAFEGDSFIVGVLGNNTRFNVLQAPTPANGRFMMNLDGEIIERI